MIPEDLRDQMVERGDALARVTGYEENARAGARVRLRGVFELGAGEAMRWIPEEELRAEWTLLGRRDVIEAAMVPVGVTCCRRCGRVNFGPCISRTCEDLQAAWAGAMSGNVFVLDGRPVHPDRVTPA